VLLLIGVETLVKIVRETAGDTAFARLTSDLGITTLS
jgi:hypothetical protein